MITEHDLDAFGYYDILAEKGKLTTNADRVREFHEAYCPDQNKKNLSETNLFNRFKLVQEEFEEYVTSFSEEEPLKNMVKELCDLLYVTYGTLIAMDVDADEAFRRVHESNMSKLGPDGKPIRDPATGKVLKGPNYKKPDLGDLID